MRKSPFGCRFHPLRARGLSVTCQMPLKNFVRCRIASRGRDVVGSPLHAKSDDALGLPARSLEIRGAGIP
jgi:hypothetical protein